MPHRWPSGQCLLLPVFARFLFALFLHGALHEVAAQDTAPTPPLVTSVTYEGAGPFSAETLELHTRTRRNRRFLGIRGMTWWLWLHRAGSKRADRRIGQALLSLGEPPTYIDRGVLADDVERLEALYRQEGYRAVDIDAQVRATNDDSSKVAVTFAITPGTPTFIRRVHYDGLADLQTEQQQRLAAASLLQPRETDSVTPLTFEAEAQRYSEPQLAEERRRVLTYLLNEGYALVTRDSIRAIVTPRRDSFDVTFRIRPGPRFEFGDVEFAIEGPEPDPVIRTDTLLVDTSGTVTVGVRGEERLSTAWLLQPLQVTPGMTYDQRQLQATKRRLEAMGVFALTDIVPVAPDTLVQPARLDHRIDLRTRPRHQIRFDAFTLQRSGALADSDTEFGAGLGVTYQNLNLFGRGEAFRLQTTGSLALDIETGLFTSTQFEVGASLTHPYLVRPFRWLDRSLRLYNARSRLSLSLLAARRDALKLVIRGRGSARFRLEMQHTPTVTSLVDVLDISLSNPDTLQGFRDDFLQDVLDAIEDPVQQAQILEDYTQPQVNNALRYRLRSSRVNPLQRDAGYSYETVVEVGGNLPYLLDRFVTSPDTLEGSVPGLPLLRGQRSDNRLIYRQYLRFVLDLRRYIPLDDRSVAAMKFIVGAAHPIGRADVVPFDRRFYSGGASSVRGWRLRELGPGPVSFADEASEGGTNLFGGDIKLETSLELRTIFLRDLLEANWMLAYFLDAGNVWFGPRNPGDAAGRFDFNRFYEEFGVGSGLGLRLAWAYLILRLDVAFKVHDPARPGSYIPDGLSDTRVHFGIGHTF